MEALKVTTEDWIGSIPESWGLERMRYSLNEINVKNSPIKTEQILSLVKDKGVMLYEEKGDVGNKAKEDITGYKVAFPNTLIVNSMNILIGSVGISSYKGCVSPVYYVFKETVKSDLRYINYIFNTREFQKELRKYANGILEIRLRVSATDIFNRKIPMPTKDEQTRIADFLDEKCAEIDKLSEDIQKQIEILEDYKKSVIIRAVTKGLNPNTKMKDSSISYVGKIPRTWNIHPIYHYFGERKHKNNCNREQNLLSLSYGKIVRKDINTNGGLLPASFSTYNIVEKGDIIIRPTDLQNDKRSLRTGLVVERGIITSAYIDLKPLDNVNSNYYHYLLHAYDTMKVFYNMGNGVRQGLNYAEFSKLLVLEPSKNEQTEIVNYLDNKCAEFDAAINLEKERYSQLQAYKKSIIYEYVTGKKRVA